MNFLDTCHYLYVMAQSTEDSLAYLLPIASSLNRIVPIFQLIFGTFGNVLNILIFTRRSLRTNPCSFYFLISSINNLFVLYVALLTRLLSSGWKIDPSNTNLALCKLRIFFVYSSLCLIQWCMVLASIDRFFCSCHSINYRHLSNLSFARRLTLAVIVVVALGHIHTLVWWSVDYIGADLYCNIFIDQYEIAFQVFFLIFSCLLPPILMMVFGLATIFNIRRIHQQIAPQTNDVLSERFRSKDRQLITMLLIQVLITIFCTAPFSAANLFDMIVRQNSTIVYSPTLKTFFDNICRIILYFNPMIGFYIYTLSSRAFRLEMKTLMKHLWARLVDVWTAVRHGQADLPMELIRTQRIIPSISTRAMKKFPSVLRFKTPTASP